jgi:hypothetical protein
MMKRRKLELFIAALVGAVVAIVVIGGALAQGMQPGGNGPGMMGGGSGPAGSGYGPGMMGGYGPTGAGYGPGMMGGVWQGRGAGQPLTSIDDARQAFQGYIEATANPDLTLDEVMQFQFNYYAIVNEQSTGHGAFELLADPQTGAVFPEFGPNMMWNTKYGHMGWWWGQQPSEQTVNADQATQIAQQWLDQNQSGSTSEATPDVFPGYYTLHTLKDSTITGMLSVNAYTGQVWYHSWHGAFVAMSSSAG